jgi:hypothetical protein
MISRQTLVTLTLALLLGLGLKSWASGRRDECDDYLAGNNSAPATQTIEAGRRSIEIPCELWIPRQSMGIQILCLLEVSVIAIFAISCWSDVRNWPNSRQKNRRKV